MSNYLSNPGHVTKKFGGAVAPEESIDSSIGIGGGLPGEDNPMMGMGMEDNPMMGMGDDSNPMMGGDEADAEDSPMVPSVEDTSVGNTEEAAPNIPDEAMPPYTKFEEDPAPSATGDEVNAGFTLVDGDHKLFAREYAPKMECPKYIGDTSMILDYLYREERKHKITLPVRACGIDPVVFEYVEHLTEGDEATPYFAIPEGDNTHVYELIEVDGDLYMSCMSECLDPDYLHSIITAATTSMMETGNYIFRMTGLKRLAREDGSDTGRLLKTLRLNTYEMSALCSYMADFGVEPTFEVINGNKCICFRMER